MMVYGTNSEDARRAIRRAELKLTETRLRSVWVENMVQSLEELLADSRLTSRKERSVRA